MDASEILTAIGTVLGAASASYGVNKLQLKKTKEPSDQMSALQLRLAAIETVFAETAELQKRLSKLEARSMQNREDIRVLREDIRQILARVPPPDLSERLRRVEDDLRNTAADGAEQSREILIALGEVRGALDALQKEGGGP